MNSRSRVQPAGQLGGLKESTQIQYVGIGYGRCGGGAAGLARQILPPSLRFGRRFLPDGTSPTMSGKLTMAEQRSGPYSISG